MDKCTEKNIERFILNNPNKKKDICLFCGVHVSVANIKAHMNGCYMNPKNLRLCPVCDIPIKDWRKNLTCSTACSNTYLRTGKNHPNYIDGRSRYRAICFRYHNKKCVICGESRLVDVHHFDEDTTNDEPENLIPLCPTHHRYMHSEYKDDILQQVTDYINLGRTGWVVNH
jgi:hypothetical protein